ncbi:MAG: hypothetical protein P4L64_04860 [Caulobacteraceae bacterium]|nr:hypothetical protein [Caulobacteraceae bacterium]
MTASLSDTLGPQATSLIIGLAVAVPVLILRNSRPRRLRIEWLWVRPGIFAGIALLVLLGSPPPLTAISVALSLASLALGCGLGWWRGKMMRIELDPQTKLLTLRASPAALVFIVVLMGLRFGARDIALRDAGALSLSLAMITDALALFTAGMLVTQCAEMWIRARRLLDAAPEALT